MKIKENSPNTGKKSLQHNNSFLRGLSAKYILSSSLAMLAVYAGALIDTVLVGGFLGEEGLGAMSLVSPVYLLYYTVGAIIGIGGSVAASHYIGTGDYKGYQRMFTCSLMIMLAMAVLMTVGGLLFLDPIVSALNKDSTHSDFVRDYLYFYILGGGFTLLAYIPLYYLKTDGRPRSSSLLFILFTIMNVILTWLFMGAFRMGVGGAALATVLSMATITVIGFIVLFDGKGETKLVSGCLKWTNFRSILITGLPSGLANLFEAIRILLINMLLMQLQLAYLLPAFTVVRNVLDLLNAIMIGISSALLPLISVFFTEHDHKSVRLVYKNVMRIGLTVSVIATLATMLFPVFISSLFGVTSAQVVSEIRFALPMACIGTWVAYRNVQLTGYYNTILRTGLSNLILFMRHLGYLIISTIVLSIFFGSAGIWLSFSICEILTFVTILGIIHRTRRKTKELDQFLLDTRLEQAVDITFSVKNNLEDIMFASNQITEFCEENEIPMKKAMKISLTIEEILSVIINKCMEKEEAFIDIRIMKLNDDVYLRIRNAGQIFDPLLYYEQNKEDEAFADELLGLKIIIGACKKIDFRKTFGVNNLLIIF